MRTSNLSYLQFFFIGIFILAYTGISLNAQAEATNYFVIKYHKVDVSDESEFLRIKLDIWKRIHEKRVEEGILDGWYFFRVVSPNGTSTNYNYITAEVYSSPEKLAKHFEGYGVDYRSILDPEEISSALRTPQLADMIYEEVWRSVDQMMINDPDNAFRFQVFNSMKLKPDTDENEYQRIESEYWKPMHRKRMDMGLMRGWGMYTMIIPGGTERDYHWATVDYYDNFIDYLKPTESILNSVHGKRNATKYFEETITKRDLLKAEIRELLAYVN